MKFIVTLSHVARVLMLFKYYIILNLTFRIHCSKLLSTDQL